MTARKAGLSVFALLLSGALQAEGLSSAESQALLDVTIEVCSKADTAKPGRYELLLEPPYACNRQDPRIVALSRARPEYREFSLKVRREFAAMPQAELLAMCQSMFEAMCEREPEQAAPAKQR